MTPFLEGLVAALLGVGLAHWGQRGLDRWIDGLDEDRIPWVSQQMVWVHDFRAHHRSLFPGLVALSALTTLWLGRADLQGWAFVGLQWGLLLLAFVDLETQLLPDGLTQPLLWGGLVFHALGGGVSLEQGVWGAVLGYLMLAGVYWGFRGLTKREGMGQGDIKLLAAIGAWMGVAQLPLILMGAASLGVVGGLFLGWRQGMRVAFPFGPFLILATECVLWVNWQGRGA